MTTVKFDFLYRLASSQAGLETGSNFFIHGIPVPDFATYADHSVRRAQALGGVARHGFEVAVLTWELLSTGPAHYIQDLITQQEVIDGVGNAILFATVIKSTASSEGPEWVDISGRAHMPNWTPDRGGAGFVYSDVTLTINNATVVSNPSTVIGLT